MLSDAARCIAPAAVDCIDAETSVGVTRSGGIMYDSWRLLMAAKSPHTLPPAICSLYDQSSDHALSVRASFQLQTIPGRPSPLPLRAVTVLRNAGHVVLAQRGSGSLASVKVSDLMHCMLPLPSSAPAPLAVAARRVWDAAEAPSLAHAWTRPANSASVGSAAVAPVGGTVHQAGADIRWGHAAHVMPLAQLPAGQSVVATASSASGACLLAASDAGTVTAFQVLCSAPGPSRLRQGHHMSPTLLEVGQLPLPGVRQLVPCGEADGQACFAALCQPGGEHSSTVAVLSVTTKAEDSADARPIAWLSEFPGSQRQARVETSGNLPLPAGEVTAMTALQAAGGGISPLLVGMDTGAVSLWCPATRSLLAAGPQPATPIAVQQLATSAPGSSPSAPALDIAKQAFPGFTLAASVLRVGMDAATSLLHVLRQGEGASPADCAWRMLRGAQVHSLKGGIHCVVGHAGVLTCIGRRGALTSVAHDATEASARAETQPAVSPKLPEQAPAVRPLHSAEMQTAKDCSSEPVAAPDAQILAASIQTSDAEDAFVPAAANGQGSALESKADEGTCAAEQAGDDDGEEEAPSPAVPTPTPHPLSRRAPAPTEVPHPPAPHQERAEAETAAPKSGKPELAPAGHRIQQSRAKGAAAAARRHLACLRKEGVLAKPSASPPGQGRRLRCPSERRQDLQGIAQAQRRLGQHPSHVTAGGSPDVPAAVELVGPLTSTAGNTAPHPLAVPTLHSLHALDARIQALQTEAFDWAAAERRVRADRLASKRSLLTTGGSRVVIPRQAAVLRGVQQETKEACDSAAASQRPLAWGGYPLPRHKQATS